MLVMVLNESTAWAYLKAVSLFFTECFIEAVCACFYSNPHPTSGSVLFLIQQRIGKGSALLCQMTLVAPATPELPVTPANSQNSQVRV